MKRVHFFTDIFKKKPASVGAFIQRQKEKTPGIFDMSIIRIFQLISERKIFG